MGKTWTTYEIWQNGTVIACASGSPKAALREASHLALVYGQDGPVDIREKKGRPKYKKRAPKGPT
jgi:hypothetical protein